MTHYLSRVQTWEALLPGARLRTDRSVSEGGSHMTDRTAREALADLIAEERDKYPRRADDMDSEELADAILAAGFRRQGPVTDADLGIMAQRFYEVANESPDITFHSMTVKPVIVGALRAALEAARG